MNGPLPELYARWVREILPGEVRGEPGSTCDDCAMCRERVAPFRMDVRCCGYLPELPNFTVGRILRDGTPAGKASLRARLDGRIAVGPLGVGVPPAYGAQWAHVERTTGFGSDPELACPHLDGDRCGIWRFREAVCTTWFCRIDGEEAGRAFWLELRATLKELEQALARWAARENGIPDGRSWGPWNDDREGWFLTCARSVEGLPWADVRRIGGFGLGVRLRSLREADRLRAAE